MKALVPVIDKIKGFAGCSISQTAINMAQEHIVARLQHVSSVAERGANKISRNKYYGFYDLLKDTSATIRDIVHFLPTSKLDNPFCWYDDLKRALSLDSIIPRGVKPSCGYCKYKDTHGACGAENSAYYVLLNTEAFIDMFMFHIYANPEPSKVIVRNIAETAERIARSMRKYEAMLKD